MTADIDQNSGLPACPNDIVSGYCLGETNFTAPATLRGNLFIFGNAINIEPWRRHPDQRARDNNQRRRE